MLYWKYAPLHRLLYIFPIFRTICEYHAGKFFPFCCERFIELFFHIFLWIKALLSKSATHSCKQVIIGRSQVWRVRRIGKYFPAECFQRVANRFCRMLWMIVMKKNDLMSPLSVLWPFFKQVNSSFQIGILLLLTFRINRFPRF